MATRAESGAHAVLRKALLAWYRDARRDLPWRRTRDPYGIWISETMLQQTRVETVLAYWPRFLARFPDVESLARASEEDVLAAWSGLGYYRRARALRVAAGAVVEQHGGRFPRDLQGALGLAGVGRYTAGAVLSIAHDERLPVVDGNVARVFSRLFALEDLPQSAGGQRRLWSLAEELLPPGGSPGEWNQAVMELGALVCTPREPTCGQCPVARLCLARAQGRAASLPRPKPRPTTLDVRLEILWVRRGGATLVERRPDDASRLAGLFELPTRETGTRSGLFPEAWSVAGLFLPGEELLRVRHAITRHRIEAVVRTARLATGRGLPGRFAWHRPGAPEGAALTGMAKKVLARGGAA